MRIAVCPGSFDPVTVGHLDIIKRASKMFDKVIVVVMSNYNKRNPSFSSEERKMLIERCTEDMDNVTVDSYMGLLADYARNKGAVAIVKGLRVVSDFEFEFQQALMNKRLCPEVETIFLNTSSENMFLSSSVVKQICELDGDITGLIPECIIDDVKERIKERRFGVER